MLLLAEMLHKVDCNTSCSHIVGRVCQVEIVASFRASSLIPELLLFTSITGYRRSTGDHELHIYKMEEVIVRSRSLVSCV